MPCALPIRSEEHTSELQSPCNLVCRLLLEKKSIQQHFLPGHDPRRAHVQHDGRHPRPASRDKEKPLPETESRSTEAVPGGHVFFFNDPAPPGISPLSLHDALPISLRSRLGLGSEGFGSDVAPPSGAATVRRSEEHTSELQSPCNIVCRLLLEK